LLIAHVADAVVRSALSASLQPRLQPVSAVQRHFCLFESASRVSPKRASWRSSCLRTVGAASLRPFEPPLPKKANGNKMLTALILICSLFVGLGRGGLHGAKRRGGA